MGAWGYLCCVPLYITQTFPPQPFTTLASGGGANKIKYLAPTIFCARYF